MSKKNMALDIALILKKEMPGIGFCNKAKRLQVFIVISNRAEKLADYDTELAIEALTILGYMSNAYHKATTMAAKNISRFSFGTLYASGWTIANILAIREGFTPHRFFRMN